MILGIDPGTTKSAIAVYPNNGMKLWEEFDNHTFITVVSDLIRIAATMNDQYVRLCIEGMEISYGNAVGPSTIETIIWTGRFIELAKSLRVPVYKVSVGDIRVKLLRSRRAKDKHVTEYLHDRFGEEGTKKNQGPLYGCSNSHRRDALMAACYLHDDFDGELVEVK